MGKVGKFVGKVGKFVGKVGNSWARPRISDLAHEFADLAHCPRISLGFKFLCEGEGLGGLEFLGGFFPSYLARTSLHCRVTSRGLRV